MTINNICLDAFETKVYRIINDKNKHPTHPTMNVITVIYDCIKCIIIKLLFSLDNRLNLSTDNINYHGKNL